MNYTAEVIVTYIKLLTKRLILIFKVQQNPYELKIYYLLLVSITQLPVCYNQVSLTLQFHIVNCV